MTDKRYEPLWIARTSNRKTGDVPTAYIGTRSEEVRDSCEGCALLNDGCYAWAGFARAAMRKHEAGYEKDPGRYKIESVLKRIDKDARFARIGAMGDPAHANRESLRRDIGLIEKAGLTVISYTHFWREPYAQDLIDICLASCETPEEAGEAAAMGWIPALVLPWDHLEENGRFFNFDIPGWGEGRGIVCPAQIKEGVTCNECLLCDVGHQAWGRSDTGTMDAIGFIDHSRSALSKIRKLKAKQGKQLPLFASRPTKKAPAYEAAVCASEGCLNPLQQTGRGRPRIYCSPGCRVKARGPEMKSRGLSSLGRG